MRVVWQNRGHGSCGHRRNHRPAAARSPGHHPHVPGKDCPMGRGERRVALGWPSWGCRWLSRRGGSRSWRRTARNSGRGSRSLKRRMRNSRRGSRSWSGRAKGRPRRTRRCRRARSIPTPGRSGPGAIRNANVAVSPATRNTSGPGFPPKTATAWRRPSPAHVGVAGRSFRAAPRVCVDAALGAFAPTDVERQGHRGSPQRLARPATHRARCGLYSRGRARNRAVSPAGRKLR
jgi:hypothetical protein